MKVIGFDVAKDSIVGIRTDRSTIIKEKFIIENTEEDIDRFFDQIKDKDFLAAAESTGDYHRALALTCLKRNIPFRLLNPILTKQFTRATVRKKKTDLTDALIIAKLALQGEGVETTEETFSHLKPMVRTSMKLADASRMFKLITRRFEGFFPEETNLIQTLKDCSEAVDRSRKNFLKRGIEYADPETTKLLLSIPGIGETISTMLCSEIGSISRFHSAKSLVAYAGLDPRIRQSGTSLNRNSHLTKRGSTYFRQALFLAAMVARRCDPELKAYYEKKRSEGRVHREAVIAVARRLTHRVYAVLKRGTPYVKKMA